MDSSPMDKGYCQVTMACGLENTKYSLFPVCDNLYHTNNGKLQKGGGIEVFGTVPSAFFHGLYQ